MTAKTKKILTILLTVLGLTAFVITPLAWFASYWAMTGGAPFQPGANSAMPAVTMWMYHSQTDIEDDGDENELDEGWYEVDADNILIADPSITIPGVVEESTTAGEDGTGENLFKYDYKSLHFGKVDNLVDLREDNKVYMRFAFNVENHGDHKMTISLAYATSGYTYETGEVSVLDSIYLYDLNAPDKATAKRDLKAAMTQTGKEGRHIIEYNAYKPGAMQFVQFRYAISNKALTPNDDAFKTMFANATAVPINCGREDGTCSHHTCDCTKIADGSTCNECAASRHSECSTCTACDANKCGSITIQNPTAGLNLRNENGTLKENNTYYLYIEFTPLLDAFGMQENILDYLVPSYMLFDVKFDIEIG